MKEYCENNINGSIWTSVHHPQTRDKHAEGIEEVPQAQAWQNMRDIDENISAYSTTMLQLYPLQDQCLQRDTMDSLMKDGSLCWLKCLNWSQCFPLTMRQRG